METLTLLEAGATTTEIAGQPVVATYDDEMLGRMAYREGAALYNRSHWGLIRLTGSTRHAFLHNLTTADINAMKPGQGCEAVFLTATARVVDLATVLATEEALWIISSPERAQTLLGWMPRFIFFNDDVQLHDERGKYAIFSLLGPASGALLSELSCGRAVGRGPCSHIESEVAGVGGVRVAVGGGLLGEGYTVIAPAEGAATLWRALRERGAEPMSHEVWEMLRVEQGRPAADRELTESFNPLEAGLWEAVSFSKGCYIGQEIVARLDTYQKLKQQLWGIRLSAAVEPGAAVRAEGRDLGAVTSATISPGGPFALAYLRTKGTEPGMAVEVGDATGEVVDLPFITRGRDDLPG